jgi:pimeloyl-ACP methyl ester carboxylesterase
VKPIPLIFVHGFKGSRLATPAGRIDWLTGATAVGLRTPNLALPARFEQGRQQEDDRRPAGPLEKVVVIPRLLEEQVYGPFLNAIRNSGVPFHPFAYDWRRDNHESSERLTDFVRTVRKQHGGGPVRIVAHSNGGLVTLHALHEGMEGVEHILFAGVPFAGGVGFLEDMHTGTASGLNKKVLSPAVVATFPSVYAFFPLHGARLTDETGHDLGIDMLQAKSWREHRLGLYQHPHRIGEDFDRFLEETLARARRFRERLVKRISAYPRIDVLVGGGHPTLAAIARKPGRHAPEWDVRNGAKEDGDGRVCTVHAVPPEGIPFERHESKFTHGAILDDPQVQKLLEIFLAEPTDRSRA